MKTLAVMHAAWTALLVNKGRSALTSLGLVIGIGAVIAMVSAGSGARLKLDQGLESVGKNVILIRAGARNAQGMVSDFVPLTRADAEAIRKEVGPLLTGVAESQITMRMMTTPNGVTATASITGSVPELQSVRHWTVAAGRFITEADVRDQADICVLGHTLRQKLFPDNPDPLGQQVRVGNLRLRVVGLLAVKGRSPTGADQDDQMMMPITTLQHKLVGEERIELIVAGAKSERVLDQAETEITDVLRRQHHLTTGMPNNFDVSSVREMAALASTLATTMQMLVAIIASISLLVGGIGIMNIMLVSVTERTREIGIRMAVGATPADVLIQFLIEAILLALIGGLIGVGVGIGGAVALAMVADWPVVVSPGVVLLAFVVSAGVGIFFGYYPAWKASRLDPIEALRYE